MSGNTSTLGGEKSNSSGNVRPAPSAIFDIRISILCCLLPRIKLKRTIDLQSIGSQQMVFLIYDSFKVCWNNWTWTFFLCLSYLYSLHKPVCLWPTLRYWSGQCLVTDFACGKISVSFEQRCRLVYKTRIIFMFRAGAVMLTLNWFQESLYKITGCTGCCYVGQSGCCHVVHLTRIHIFCSGFNFVFRSIFITENMVATWTCTSTGFVCRVTCWSTLHT